MDYQTPTSRKHCGILSVQRIRWTRLSASAGLRVRRTIYGKLTHTTSHEGTPHLTDRQKWLKDNFSFLHTHILPLLVHHISCKSAFKPVHEATASRPPDAGPSADSGGCSSRPYAPHLGLLHHSHSISFSA